MFGFCKYPSTFSILWKFLLQEMMASTSEEDEAHRDSKHTDQGKSDD